MNTKRKFVSSLVAFAGLALLSWQTLSNDPMVLHDRLLGFDVNIRFRTATLMVLGLLAALTTLSYWRTTMEERREANSKHES